MYGMLNVVSRLQHKLRSMNTQWIEEGRTTCEMGIGIHSGKVLGVPGWRGVMWCGGW